MYLLKQPVKGTITLVTPWNSIEISPYHYSGALRLLGIGVMSDEDD